jgi:hypothetical protein
MILVSLLQDTFIKLYHPCTTFNVTMYAQSPAVCCCIVTFKSLGFKYPVVSADHNFLRGFKCLVHQSG